MLFVSAWVKSILESLHVNGISLGFKHILAFIVVRPVMDEIILAIVASIFMLGNLFAIGSTA
jgi:hypothetical protein